MNNDLIDARTDYELVLASQTTQVIGPTGVLGDVIEKVVIIPTTTSPGAVALKDGAGSAFNIFDGGASSVSNLAPVTVLLGARSMAGAWQVTTGANVRALVIGRFQP